MLVALGFETLNAKTRFLLPFQAEETGSIGIGLGACEAESVDMRKRTSQKAMCGKSHLRGSN